MVIYGVNAVVEALASGVTIESVQLASGLRGATRREIEGLAHQRGVGLHVVQRRDLDRLTAGAVHQGVVALWRAGEPMALDELGERTGPGRTLLLCLDEVQDPRNLGALARSALAFGACGLVIPDRRAAGVTPAAVKASAGALLRLPIARVKNLARALEQLKKKGFWVTGASGGHGRDPWDFDPGEKVALVLGSEGGGLRPAVAAHLDFTVHIPMDEALESLNVSVVGALLMYEWLVRGRLSSETGETVDNPLKNRK